MKELQSDGDVLDTSYEIVKLIKKSPRRDAMLQKEMLGGHQLLDLTAGIRVLYSARWSVLAQALHSIIDNLQEAWDESLAMQTEMQARIASVSLRTRTC